MFDINYISWKKNIYIYQLFKFKSIKTLLIILKFIAKVNLKRIINISLAMILKQGFSEDWVKRVSKFAKDLKLGVYIVHFFEA